MTSQEWLAMSGLFGFAGILFIFGLFAKANERWKKRQIELGNVPPWVKLPPSTSEPESPRPPSE